MVACLAWLAWWLTWSAWWHGWLGVPGGWMQLSCSSRFEAFCRRLPRLCLSTPCRCFYRSLIYPNKLLGDNTLKFFVGDLRLCVGSQWAACVILLTIKQECFFFLKLLPPQNNFTESLKWVCSCKQAKTMLPLSAGKGLGANGLALDMLRMATSKAVKSIPVSCCAKILCTGPPMHGPL